MQASAEGIAFHRDGVIADANPPLCELLGYTLDEVRGRQAIDFVAPDQRAHVQAVLDAGRDLSYESAVVRKDGQRIPVELIGRTLVYGGSRQGSMGALADGALSAGGHVIGVMPGFLQALEIAHDRLSELHIVGDLRERKQWMLCRASAVIALPGGTGTFEELLEARTLKRLGIFFGPIVICNQRRFYDPLLALLESAVDERFMAERHRAMWQVVETAAAAVEALEHAPPWPEDALRFAAV